ncbi:hypothetical protein [Nocardia sp. NPDC046763]|uniref:hypothetical protein n=1 Tax=Nocardia sp. NPDC046763 TaxID=3155256 RepID=UPI003400C4C1
MVAQQITALFAADSITIVWAGRDTRKVLVLKTFGMGMVAAGAMLLGTGLGAAPALAAAPIPLEPATVDTSPVPQGQPVVGMVSSGSSSPGLLCSLSGYGPTNDCFMG